MTEPSDFDRAEDPTDEMRADELASAFVDGALTDEEAAEVRSNPDLMARVAEFETVAAATSEPVTPPPAATKAAHIAAAMAAFDAGGGQPVAEPLAEPGPKLAAEPSPEPGNETAPPVDLRDRRQARAERGNRMLLTLAAAFVVLGGIGLASWRLGSSSSDDTAAVADEAFGDAETTQSTTVSASNAEAAGEALEAEAMAQDEMADADMEADAMEDEAEFLADDAASDDTASSEVIESGDEAEDDADIESTEESADFGALRLAGPPDEFTIDELFAQSLDSEPFPLEESACAAELGIVDGVWYVVENADGSLAEFIVELTPEGEQVGRLLDATCTLLLP